jgi:hypothetical protein
MASVARSPRSAALALLLLVAPTTAWSQDWNSATARAITQRAIARRSAERADSGLRDFQARAHGFVFFLAQLGEGFNEPPRLIKTDQLESEVYWKAPGASKQRIVGWRDRVDLPAEIHYHRDHLGIVQNGFANHIRIGEGDEVRDVPHPLSPAGDSLYDFAVVDSLVIELPQHTIRVYEVLVRPRSFDAPRVVGAVYLDVSTAELVRFRFNFTRAAYLDPSLEDITIVLDNGLWDERYWLPRRQEIEIRRRTAWLDLPARGIIRGRWDISAYAFNVGLADSLFRGQEIVPAALSVRDSFPWPVSLAQALRDASQYDEGLDLDRVRAEVAGHAPDQMLNRLATSEPSIGSISDVAHFNRVEGLALGAGFRWRSRGGHSTYAWMSYGLSDETLKARTGLEWERGLTTFALAASREVRDIGDEPVASRVVNSISAQEGGADFGDYVRLIRGTIGVSRRFAAGGRAALVLGFDGPKSLAIRATPSWGTFRPNPALGDSGAFWFAGLDAERHHHAPGSEVAWAISTNVTVAAHAGPGLATKYARGRMAAMAQFPVGPSALRLNGWAGAGTADLPAYRTFLVGGRGTLLGEPFRAYGGRTAAVASAEWRWTVPFPALPLGPFGSTGSDAVVAPFVAVGWADHPVAGTPWAPTDGFRPVAGAAVELFHRLVRCELGVGLRDGGVGFSVDLLRDLWPIL